MPQECSFIVDHVRLRSHRHDALTAIETICVISIACLLPIRPAEQPPDHGGSPTKLTPDIIARHHDCWFGASSCDNHAQGDLPRRTPSRPSRVGPVLSGEPPTVHSQSRR
jgi:hypothetical protein